MHCAASPLAEGILARKICARPLRQLPKDNICAVLMPQVFHPSMNTIARASIFGAVFILAGIGWVLWSFYRSSYTTQVGVVRPQPVEFSHEHHVGGLGIDCRYCHTSVEESSYAGIPPTQICMQCHSQIWADSPKLEPVRASFRTGESIPWTRVHDLPDFVYFDHSIHVKKGVGCVSCHGQVDTMPLMWRTASLHMQWCLDCHRDPEPFIRPRDEVFSMKPWPAANSTRHGAEEGSDAGAQAASAVGEGRAAPSTALDLMELHQIASETSCSVCHR